MHGRAIRDLEPTRPGLEPVEHTTVAVVERLDDGQGDHFAGDLGEPLGAALDGDEAFRVAGDDIAGVVAIVVGAGNTGGSSLFGDFLALINALTWTFYFISSKRRRVDGVDTWQFLYGVSVIQVLVVVPYSLITSDDILQITLRDLGFLIAMTLFSGTIGHSFMLWAQKYVDASVSSLILLLGPVISSIGAWLVYNQNISVIQVIGGAVVLASLAGVVRLSSAVKISREVLSTADPLLNSNP